MVLPILVLPAAHWHGVDGPRPVERMRTVDLYKGKRRLAAGPRWRAMSRQRHRVALMSHWAWMAARCAPQPLPPLVAERRTSVGCRNLLAQCEALLRQLLRRRRDTQGLLRSDLVHVAAEFDGNTLRAPVRSVAANAFLLASMYWDGCRHPLSLFAAPLHPPTGLVRWLTGFSVHKQVEHGRLLLMQLAQEEQRMFEFALRLMTRIDAMTVNRDRGLVLLPELLKIAEEPNIGQRDSFTTFGD
ncbi:MAG: hypothetical protein Q8R98_03765 [Rubrivivax sp.]|nr:hypothetical protein [Rubrivivax sp.]MDP3224541.1 hypothetical protein [Rubrivivax sp.]MDP3610945.1 hypothetical protein [Rubrivivax sp.]